MIAFIKGKIHSFHKDSLVIEQSGIGYRVYVPIPHTIQLHSEITLYTYQHVKEDGITLFGFCLLEEHELFLQLIRVKGIGPKTALNMLGVSSAKQIIRAIETEDINVLKTFPGIGAKSASQMVLDLKGKLVDAVCDVDIDANQAFLDAVDALKTLGYKSMEINSVKKELSMQKDNTCDQYVRLALGILAKRKGV